MPLRVSSGGENAYWGGAAGGTSGMTANGGISLSSSDIGDGPAPRWHSLRTRDDRAGRRRARFAGPPAGIAAGDGPRRDV